MITSAFTVLLTGAFNPKNARLSMGIMISFPLPKTNPPTRERKHVEYIILIGKSSINEKGTSNCQLLVEILEDTNTSVLFSCSVRSIPLFVGKREAIYLKLYPGWEIPASFVRSILCPFKCEGKKKSNKAIRLSVTLWLPSLSILHVSQVGYQSRIHRPRLMFWAHPEVFSSSGLDIFPTVGFV
jgi:hypothetical protein